MRTALLFLLLTLPAFANYANGVYVALEAGATTLRISNSGPLGGGVLDLNFANIAFTRIGVLVTPIHVPPKSTDTFTSCTAPCGVGGTSSLTDVDREGGIQYIFMVELDMAGAPVAPFKWYGPAPAYKSRVCDAPGTLPLIPQATVTTEPLPMPREVIGQDCYIDTFRVPLQLGHASTNVDAFMTIYNLPYKQKTNYDGKISIRVNGGTWQPLSNTNSDFSRVDQGRFFVVANASYATSDLAQQLPVGGFMQTGDYLLAIPDGTIGAMDTHATVEARFNGTDGIGSGARILVFTFIEGTHHVLTDLDVVSKVATAVKASHGFTTSDDVMIWGAQGPRMGLNGMHDITSVPNSSTFVYTACDLSTGRSRLTSCFLPDGDYMPPVNRDPQPTVAPARVQGVAYAAKMLVARSAYDYTENPDNWTAPAGADAAAGLNMIQQGNEAGTPDLINQMVNPVAEHLDDTLKYGKCGNCHSPTAADLKYFGYSNKAIVDRSIFHGLTRQQGENVAASVRGNAIQRPTTGYPWNPFLQTGPGLSVGKTFRRSDSTLTNVVVATNVATATITPSHMIKAGDPICVYGATVDLDLNACPHVTSITATTVVWPTTAVADATYTEATLSFTMGNESGAGCGLDCVDEYGYSLAALKSYGDPPDLDWDGHIEGWDVSYPWQFTDWGSMLPTFFPADVGAGAAFLTSTPYLYFLGCWADITKGDFTSFKAANYCSELFAKYIAYWGRQEAQGVENPPTSTDKYKYYQAGNLPAWSETSIHSQIRYSVLQTNMVQHWALTYEKELVALNHRRMVDIRGAPTKTGCYPPWGISNESFWFNTADHKAAMQTLGPFNGIVSDFFTRTNVMYLGAMAANSGDCWGRPDAPIDVGYLLGYMKDHCRFRSCGYALQMVPAIMSVQVGRELPDLFRHDGDGNGIDWTGAFTVWWPEPGAKNAFWHHTTAEVKAVIDFRLDALNSLTGSRTGAYWDNVFSNTSPVQTACGSIGTSYLGGTDLICVNTAINITLAKLFGADATKLSTFKAWAAARWPGHDFDADETAATQGDTANDATGDLSTPGAVTVTFTNSCPTSSAAQDMAYTIVGTGGQRAEYLKPTGGTCAAPGGSGTLTFTTTRAHTGTLKVRFGCTIDQLPNYPIGNYSNPDSEQWYRCGNMF